MMYIRYLGSNESLRIKHGICMELCLKLWFESGWYFFNITESGWFWKRLPRKKLHIVLSSQFEKVTFQKYIAEFWIVISNQMINPFSTNVPLLHSLKTSENRRCSDIFRGYRSGTLVENVLSISFPIRGSIKLVIINMTYTCMESSHSKQLIKILTSCLQKLDGCTFH